MKKIFTAMLMLCSSIVLAQQVIQGKIVSSGDNAPLPGVSIIIKGTSIGTTTDINGGYSLNASPTDVLQYSYIGYTKQEITVGNQTQIDVTLQVDTDQLEEVVVIGYGEQKKVNVTGAVESMALHARIALYDVRYAAAAAKQVIDNGSFSLHPDYEELFSPSGASSNEIMFMMPFQNGFETTQSPLRQVRLKTTIYLQKYFYLIIEAV